MSKDARALREEAAEATATGKHKRALAAYLELERLEPRDAQWAKRAGETYRKLGNNKLAVEAFVRSAERYAQNGFLVQAIAVCKLILQIEPLHSETLQRLARMNEMRGSSPTRTAAMAENNPTLHENPDVEAIRRRTTQNPPPSAAGTLPGTQTSAPATNNPAPATRMQTKADTPPAALPAIKPATRITTPATTAPTTQAAPMSTPPQMRSAPTTATQAHAPTTMTPQSQPLSARSQPESVSTQPQMRSQAPVSTQPQMRSAPTATPQPRPAATPMPPSTQPLPTIAQPRPAATPMPSSTEPLPTIAQPRPAATPMPSSTEPLPTVAQPQQRSSQPHLGRAQTADGARKRQSTPPTVSRTKSKPVSLPPGAGIDAVELRTEVPDAYPRDVTSKGIHVIPIDDIDPHAFDDRASTPIIEVEGFDELSTPIEVVPEEELLELVDDDIEEIPLPDPRGIGAAAQRALAATPLFSDLPSETLELLVENLAIVTLQRGEVLFREGDLGDALYVIVEGEVAVVSEGPPRVEMARLGPGSFIGEIALMTDQPRSATVIGVLASELLRIDRGSLARVLSDHGDLLTAVLRFVRHRLVDRWMRTSPLTRVLTDEEREELASKFTFLEIEADTKLITGGAKPDGLYIILSGEFVVERDGRTITTLGAGHFIGETALLSRQAFRSDVIARSKGLALCLPAPAFREMAMQHPHVLDYIGEQAELSRRLQIL